nr:hypothetical protein [Nocardia sp. NRRL S-836]
MPFIDRSGHSDAVRQFGASFLQPCEVGFGTPDGKSDGERAGQVCGFLFQQCGAVGESPPNFVFPKVELREQARRRQVSREG